MTPKKLLKIAVFGMLALLIFGSALVYFLIADGLPSLEQLENPPQELATRIISADGELLDNFFIKRRTYVPYNQISPEFINALIATEDREFYNHWGVHLSRIGKAMIKNIMRGRNREGASTITQQLALNLYFKREPSYIRKLKEAVTAVQIESNYTKQEILEMYANTVYYGRGAYGIQVASESYFNKDPKDLTTAEAAYLVGILRGPENYDAAESEEKLERATHRRNVVLNLMNEVGLLGDAETQKAKATPLRLAAEQKTNTTQSIAPHFVEWIRQSLRKDSRLQGYDPYRDGLTIYTTLNAQMQRYANQAVAEHMVTFQKQVNSTFNWRDRRTLLDSLVRRAVRMRPDYIAANASGKRAIATQLFRNAAFIDSVKTQATIVQTGVVVLDASSGAILAMVGASPLSMQGNSAARYSLNHVTQIRRQPGSAFKPFVYASALENGLRPSSTVSAAPYSYTLPSGEVWSPQGSGKEGASYTLSTALQFSINTVSARLITQHTSPGEVIRLAKRMGISTPIPSYPSIALGAGEVIPLEMASAYGVFANQGIYVEPVRVTRIEDRYGNVIYTNKLPSVVKDALSPGIANNMTTMMQAVVNRGTAAGIRRFYKHDAAGKTGTTNNFADAWFVGYTPELTASVWVGFDDQRVKFTGWYGQGGTAAAPIWGRLMGKIYADPSLGYRQTRFQRGVVSEPIDPTRVASPPSEDVLPESEGEPNTDTDMHDNPSIQPPPAADRPATNQGGRSLPPMTPPATGTSRSQPNNPAPVTPTRPMETDQNRSSGSTPGRPNPSGTNPTGTNPTGTSPSGTTPSGTNPSGTSPAGTNPGKRPNSTYPPENTTPRKTDTGRRTNPLPPLPR
ncbi:MAG TPA: PBP1A family penicillin-binding protein [Patescibacteria group bacterium]|nr:PBP1A family penicillin-binding protein [Patescibacteria group bacterium]